MPLPPDCPKEKNAAIAWLFQRHYLDLCRFVLKRLSGRSAAASRSEVNDFVQQAFAKLLDTGNLDRVEDFHKFLSSIAANKLIDAHRRASISPVYFDSDQANEAAERPIDLPTADAGTAVIDMQIDLDNALAMLPPQNRELLRLKYEGHTVAEIAARTGLSAAEVGRLITETYARMKQAMWPEKDR